MPFYDAMKIATPKWDPLILPSMAGKVAIVTGANTPEGIGYHTAHQLALKGATVHVSARSFSKAQSGIESMLQESPDIPRENLKPLALDLSNLKEVKSVAEKFVGENERLDILVNNAGLLPGPLEIGSHGISTQTLVNHLSPMLFTLTLLPLLKRTALTIIDSHVRIVNVSSTSHIDAPPTGRFISLADFNATFPDAENGEVYTRYGHSKLANALFSVELQTRLTAESVPIVITYPHPGGIASAGSAKFLGGMENDVFRNAMSPYEGSLTPLWCAVHPDVKNEEKKWRGKYVMPFGGVWDGNRRVWDGELRSECWEGSLRIIESVVGK